MVINIGIIGCGRFALRRIIPALVKNKNFKLFGIQSRSIEKLSHIISENNISYCTDKEKELVSHPEIDAIIISSPPFLHKKHVLLSAENGLPILCEKPLAIDFDDCEKILKSLPEQYPLLVGYCYRFKDSIAKTREMILNKEIGGLKSICVKMCIPVQKDDWRYVKSLGGGVLLDIGIHVIDFIRFLTKSEFISVKAVGKHHKDKNNEFVETTVHVSCFLENDISASFSISFDDPYETGFTAVGTKGSIKGDYTFRQADDNKESLKFIDLRGDSHYIAFCPNNIYETQLNHFADVIKNKISSSSLAKKGMCNYQVIDMIKKSMQKHF